MFSFHLKIIAYKGDKYADRSFKLQNVNYLFANYTSFSI